MPGPNILYIHSHDTGRYVQPYGHAVPTPKIQQLAKEGVLFRQAFCAGPTCSPSRASLLTGQWPHSNGMLGLASLGFSLNDYGQHIVHTLRNAGYRTVLSGVQHVAKDPAQIGYDERLDVKAGEAADGAARFLLDAPAQPFFLTVGFSETHRKFREPGPGEDWRYCLPPPPLPDTPETRKDMAAFKASARAFDEEVGRVLAALDAAGLADNTLVICTTDHGIAFPAMKCNLTDHGIGVMLIVRGPGGFHGGQVCDALVSHIDIFPTLCDLIGIDRPDWLQGQSLIPLIRREAAEVNEQIVAEINYHDAYDPQRCVRTRRWKYIRRFADRDRPLLPNCDNGPSKDLWLEHGWAGRHVPREQLFDLMFDPNEANSLADDPCAAPVLSEMRERLDRHMQATDDPLLRGPIPAPADAIVADASDVSELTPDTIRRLRSRKAEAN